MVETEEESTKSCIKRASFQCEEGPLTEDVTCGFGYFRGPLLQKFASKKYLIILYGCLGLCQLTGWAYFNGTISTMEKRFKIPSKVTGLITAGSDISGLFASVVASYWGGKGHRPRWIAFGLLTYVIQMLLTALPHFIYGPGEDALKLTEEYGAGENFTIFDYANHDRRFLCKGGELCNEDMGSIAQPLILFLSQFVGGIGGSLHWTLGVAYIDDNLRKSETPFFISLSFCIRMIGPSIGYALASTCLKHYIVPSLTPKIHLEDPRWMGAWWLGWLILSGVTLLLTFPMALFPKVLPESAANKNNSKIQDYDEVEEVESEQKPSLKDLIVTIKRLCKNKIFFCNNLATIFYVLGEDPYWIYLAKYIEAQYNQTASAANFITGTVGLGSSALGILLSGIVISKLKPKARTLAAWNVFIGVLTFSGILSYIFIDCDEKRILKSDWMEHEGLNYSKECSSSCGCDFVPYNPVCSDSNVTFISACHAGCRSQFVNDGTTIYTDCSCVDAASGLGTAINGPCPIDCTVPFHKFLAVLSILNIAGATGIASNFLVGMRCIDEKDKSAAMGLSHTLLSTLAFAPAPVLYGYILDTTCQVWGKTCSGKGNCWVYDSKDLAYTLNITAAGYTPHWSDA